MKLDNLYARRQVKRPPCKTATEFAEEFGVSPQLLGRLLQEPGAPAPEFDGHKLSQAKRARWYSVKEMRKWWASRNQEAA